MRFHSLLIETGSLSRTLAATEISVYSTPSQLEFVQSATMIAYSDVRVVC